nr:hypothetical protein [Tanacetum cinerariifolium]
ICPLCNSMNSCAYDSNPNSYDCPPDSHHPPHSTYETYSGDSCGNNSQSGYDYPPQFPLNYEPEPGYTQNYNSCPHDSLSFSQQYPCCDDCRKQEEMRIEEEQAASAQYRKLPVCYDNDDDEEESNYLKDNIISELPPCSAVTPSEPIDSLSMGDEHLDTISETESDEFIKSCVENLVPNPMTPTKPVDSLSMGDEHLDTILATESDEFIKSCVENLVLNPSESEGENECDVPAGFTTFSNVLFD